MFQTPNSIEMEIDLDNGMNPLYAQRLRKQQCFALAMKSAEAKILGKTNENQMIIDDNDEEKKKSVFADGMKTEEKMEECPMVGPIVDDEEAMEENCVNNGQRTPQNYDSQDEFEESSPFKNLQAIFVSVNISVFLFFLYLS